MRKKWTFDSGKNNFAYEDDVFRSTEEPKYAEGKYIKSGGYNDGGALKIVLGGLDGEDISGMSGGWRKSFTIDEAQPVKMTFRYKVHLGADYDPSEYSEVLVSLDGKAFGKAGKDHVARISGDDNPSTGWKKVTIDLGDLSAGKHTLEIGGFNNSKTSKGEVTRIFFDNVVVKTAVPPLGGFEARVLELTNEFREDNGMAPLVNDERLNSAAEDWSRTMAREDFFAHSTPEQVEEHGYDWSSWGENIAAGYQTPEDVVEGWINSPGHRANLLSDDFREIGVGYYLLSDDTGSANYHHYWTQAFGTEEGSDLLMI